MVNFYQELVSSYQYSLQILAHCKQNSDLDKLLKHYEAKLTARRVLEIFLTDSMFQLAPSPVLEGTYLGSLLGVHGSEGPSWEQATAPGTMRPWPGEPKP